MSRSWRDRPRRQNLVAHQAPQAMLLEFSSSHPAELALTAKLREWTQMPILILSTRHREEEIVAALDAGADGYLIKPFGLEELAARLRCQIRRPEWEAPQPPLALGSLLVDRARRRVLRDGVEVHLTPMEYKLLHLLAIHAGKVLTHGQILREVWGNSAGFKCHLVRVHVAELRRKLERDPARPRWLLTEPAVGYSLRDG